MQLTIKRESGVFIKWKVISSLTCGYSFKKLEGRILLNNLGGQMKLRKVAFEAERAHIPQRENSMRYRSAIYGASVL